LAEAETTHAFQVREVTAVASELETRRSACLAREADAEEKMAQQQQHLNAQADEMRQVLALYQEKQLKLQQWHADVKIREQRVHAAEIEVERQREALDRVWDAFVIICMCVSELVAVCTLFFLNQVLHPFQGL
jgi:hypothetical protein